jgi:hypothetical protein
MKKIVLALLTLTIVNFCNAQAVTKKKKSVKKPANTIKFTPPKIVLDEEVTPDEKVILTNDSENEEENKPGNTIAKDTIAILKRPPLPPIPKGSVVKANKMAAEFVKNKMVASKKYKNFKYSFTVEGVVKDVKEIKTETFLSDYNFIITLDGFPAAMDVQCKISDVRKKNKLSKGMKAVFMAYYESVEDNAIVLNCIYLENPTYE